MTLKLLDLDSSESWHPAIEALVYSSDVWPRIEAKLDGGSMQCAEFLLQVRCDEDYLKDEVAKLLRNLGREILFSRYTHVAGYHGCRPKDLLSYQNQGILPSNTELLVSEARSMFEDIGGFEEALKSIGTEYLTHNEGKVGLLLSAVRAKHDRNAYVKGSELVRSIAHRLGPEAEKRYEVSGRPTLIKCAIPVDWLDKHTTFPVAGVYINNVLEEFIRRRKWPGEGFIGFDGGYMLTRAVPPGNTLEIIDMNSISDALFGDGDRMNFTTG
jgi:hypothetical protein